MAHVAWPMARMPTLPAPARAPGEERQTYVRSGGTLHFGASRQSPDLFATLPSKTLTAVLEGAFKAHGRKSNCGVGETSNAPDRARRILRVDPSIWAPKRGNPEDADALPRITQPMPAATTEEKNATKIPKAEKEARCASNQKKQAQHLKEVDAPLLRIEEGPIIITKKASGCVKLRPTQTNARSPRR